MLTRAYGVLGGTLPEEDAEAGFTDGEKIADWAKESASVLASWNVMNGLEDGSSSPDGNYTVEQCIVTFLRLYENAPVSRKNGNVTPLFTYEQGIEYILHNKDFVAEGFRIEGPVATFIRANEQGSVMLAQSSSYFVYRDGGVIGIEPGVWDESYGFSISKKLIDPHFSEDGKTFYYTVTLKENNISYLEDSDGELLYKKGIYHITVDVDTGKAQVQREDLPQ